MRQTKHCDEASPRKPTNGGYTLLEVILTIALSVVVMMLVGIAVDGHYQLVNGGREKVEEAQLARALLHQIADDLRSTVRFEPIDMSSVEALLSGGEDLSDDLDDIDDELGDDLGGGLGEGDQEDADEEPAPVEDIAQGYVPPNVPGLYGNATEILMDVSRLPRVDEYELMLLSAPSGAAEDIPSDLKSVAYYIGSESSSTVSAPASKTAEPPGGGLVRRSLDRAVTMWAAENGTTNDLERSADLLAPEVTAIGFRYFDGTEWSDEWNSETRGGIPVAVEISLTLASRRQRSVASRAIASLSGSDGEAIESHYLQIVHLPGAEPTDADGSLSGAEEASEMEAAQ